MGDLDVVPFAGVRWYAGGVYHRDNLPAASVKTRILNEIRQADIVYNRMWATKASFGVVGDDANGCLVTNDFPIFNATPEALPDFIGLLFWWGPFQQAASAAATGTTERRRLNEKDFVKLRMPIPPLSEQQRIIDLVGALDVAVTAAEQDLNALDSLCQRLRDLVPYGPDKAMGEVLLGIESGTSTKPVTGAGDPAYVLSLAAIRPARFSPSEVKDVGPAQLPEKSRLVEGDLLITRSNTPDRVGYVCVARNVPSRTHLPDLVWRLVPDRTQVSADYLEQALSSSQLRGLISGGATGTSESMKKINKANFSGIRIPVPDRDVQDAYVEPLRELGAVRDRQEHLRRHLIELRSNLLTALLSGEHEIPESYDGLIKEAS